MTLVSTTVFRQRKGRMNKFFFDYNFIPEGFYLFFFSSLSLVKVLYCLTPVNLGKPLTCIILCFSFLFLFLDLFCLTDLVLLSLAHTHTHKQFHKSSCQTRILFNVGHIVETKIHLQQKMFQYRKHEGNKRVCETCYSQMESEACFRNSFKQNTFDKLVGHSHQRVLSPECSLSMPAIDWSRRPPPAALSSLCCLHGRADVNNSQVTANKYVLVAITTLTCLVMVLSKYRCT